MNPILVAVIFLEAIASVLATILYIASKKLVMYEDLRIVQVSGVLPQANCGGCGYPGRNGFADACARVDSLGGKLHSVGGQPVMSQIVSIPGPDVGTAESMVAVVRRSGTCANRLRTNTYGGAKSCVIVASLYGGKTDCSHGCLGYGGCVAVCQSNAIHMNPETGFPEVDEEKCAACGACAKACPKVIVELRAKGKEPRHVYVFCANRGKGTVARKAYTVSYISCGKCVKTCSLEAVTLENNLAYIDYSKCKSYRKCVGVCPWNIIIELNFLPRKPKGEVPVAEAAKTAEV